MAGFHAGAGFDGGLESHLGIGQDLDGVGTRLEPNRCAVHRPGHNHRAGGIEDPNGALTACRQRVIEVAATGRVEAARGPPVPRQPGPS